MKSIRKAVFETNSSSTHSLTLLKTDRKFTRVGKLIPFNTYTYKPLGYKNSQKKYFVRISSEYEKLCTCFDLLFLEYSEKQWQAGVKPRDPEKYRKSAKDDYLTILYRYYLEKFYRTDLYSVFIKVLQNRNIKFELNDLAIGCGSEKDKRPIYCSGYDGGSFEFMSYFYHWNFKSLDEALEVIIFNPNFVIEYDYHSC